MEPLRPATPEELAEVLASAGAEGKTIDVSGAGSKTRMTGPLPVAEVSVTTTGLARILDYEPKDLTVSVEAGLPFAELSRTIAADGLMLPLDPPFFDRTTVGGLVAANVSGPRRRQYGTARDLIIGVRFATLAGRLVQSGGMVVKNAAGLEMGKLMVGSFGTLGAIAAVNFRLAPIPPATRTFILRHATIADAFRTRDKLVRGVLQPTAIDILNPAAAERVGLSSFAALVQAGGNEAVVERYTRELAGAESLDGADQDKLWVSIREFTPAYLSQNPAAAVVRISTAMAGIERVMADLEGPAIARAGSGVVYAFFEDCTRACQWLTATTGAGHKAVLEYVPEKGCTEDRWPMSGSDIDMMRRIKRMFDPNQLLNRGRLYGRI